MADDDESTALHFLQAATKAELSANDSPKAAILRDMKDVGERIREARKSVKLSQVDVAKALSVSRTAISNWERGEGAKHANLDAVARLTGVTIDWLMSGAGDGKPLPQKPADRLLVDAVALEQLLEFSYEILGIPKAHARQLAASLIGAAAVHAPLVEGLHDPDLSRRLAHSLVQTFSREPR